MLTINFVEAIDVEFFPRLFWLPCQHYTRGKARDFTHKRRDNQNLIFAAGIVVHPPPTEFLLSIRSFDPRPPSHPSTLRTMDAIDMPYNATPAGRIFVQPNRHDVLCGRGKVRNRAYCLAYKNSLIFFLDFDIFHPSIIKDLTHSLTHSLPSFLLLYDDNRIAFTMTGTCAFGELLKRCCLSIPCQTRKSTRCKLSSLLLTT
jgi:hypothetical protein